eukprot:366111-Chlamydomonas_euryale.AAC.2
MQCPQTHPAHLLDNRLVDCQGHVVVRSRAVSVRCQLRFKHVQRVLVPDHGACRDGEDAVRLRA